MRAQSIYDRGGNSYRYQRALADEKEKRERIARSKLWDDIYRKVLPNPGKDEETD